MYLGCSDCGGNGCAACATYDQLGAYQLGVVPFLLVPSLVQAIRRGAERRRARRDGRQPGPPQAAPQPQPQPQLQPPNQPPRRGTPLLDLAAKVLATRPAPPDDDDDEQDEEDLGGPVSPTWYPPPASLGVSMLPAGRRCRVQRTPQGDAIVDSATNQILGYVDMPTTAPSLGDVDAMGYDELGDDDDDDDDELGADDLGAEVDEAIGYAMSTGDDQALGNAESRLERRISAIDDAIARLRDRSASVRNPFAARKRAKIKKQIDKKQRAKRKLTLKLRQLQGAQSQVRAAARGTPVGGQSAAAAAGAGAAGAALAAMGLGGPPVWNTRAALTAPTAQIANPAVLAQMRRLQAADGLRFSANAPPGSGRLTNIPFYADVDVGNPRNALTVPAGGLSAATTLRTKNLPYATCVLTGFGTTLYGTDAANNAVGLVRNLQVEGGTNLFLANNWLEASNFADRQALQGLRSYPQLQTTNNGQVEVAAAGDTDDVVVISCSLIVDVISDDTYGLGVPGVYAG